MQTNVLLYMTTLDQDHILRIFFLFLYKTYTYNSVQGLTQVIVTLSRKRLRLPLKQMFLLVNISWGLLKRDAKCQSFISYAYFIILANSFNSFVQLERF